MDFLNEALRQTKDALSSMTVGARIASALLLTAIIVSLAYLFLFRAEAGMEYMYSGDMLSQDDQAKILGLFAEAGLKKWQTEGGRIKVPRNQVHKYYAAVSAKGFVPQNASEYVSNALKDTGIFSTPRPVREEKIRDAKQKELSFILSTMKGIQRAWVSIDQQRKRGLHGDLQATALASIKAEGGQQLDEDQLRAIRNAIAARYAPLKRKDVSILDLNANMTYRGDQGIGMMDDVYASRKRMYERNYKSMISNLVVRTIPGALVEVSVKMDPDEGKVTRTVKLDPKTVPVESHETTNETKTTGGRRGRPGAAPNGVGNRGGAVAAGSSSVQNSISETTNRTKSRTGATQTETRTAGFVPQIVRAAVFVPISYYTQVWNDRQTKAGAAGGKKGPATPGPGDLAKIKDETRRNIQTLVANLLPDLPGGVNQFPHVAVQSYQDLPVAAPPIPSMTSSLFTWLGEQWTTLAMLGLGLFSLLMLRGVITAAKPVSGAESTAALATAAAELDGDSEEELSDEESSLLRRFSASGRGLREELSELVREDPDAAASVLKNWVAEPA